MVGYLVDINLSFSRLLQLSFNLFIHNLLCIIKAHLLLLLAGLGSRMALGESEVIWCRGMRSAVPGWLGPELAELGGRGKPATSGSLSSSLLMADDFRFRETEMADIRLRFRVQSVQNQQHENMGKSR